MSLRFHTTLSISPVAHSWKNYIHLLRIFTPIRHSLPATPPQVWQVGPVDILTKFHTPRPDSKGSQFVVHHAKIANIVAVHLLPSPPDVFIDADTTSVRHLHR